MANRTIKILGRAYGTEPAAMTINCNGVAVFSGEVPTVILKPGQRVPVMSPNMEVDPIELCSFEIIDTVTGLVPMTVEVTAGSIMLAHVFSNHMMILNPVYSPEQLSKMANPATTDAERFAIFDAIASPAFSLAEKTTLLDPAALDTDKDAILTAHNCDVMVSTGDNCVITMGDPRHNVTIDGVPNNPDRTDFGSATWWWMIHAGSIMACNFEVPSET
jgi:hypothetical protein